VGKIYYSTQNEELGKMNHFLIGCRGGREKGNWCIIKKKGIKGVKNFQEGGGNTNIR